jgi:L-2-hydroxyglutarate oxidase LhgO
MDLFQAEEQSDKRGDREDAALMRTLAARYAVRGAAEMVKFCAEYGIAHAVTGKLIDATEREELPRLHALVQRGRENGIPVRELGPSQIGQYEPEVRGLAGIHVGTTGICDYVAVARQLAESATHDRVDSTVAEALHELQRERDLTVRFDIDEYTRWRLLEGLDDIGLTLRHAEMIAEFEAARPERMPTTS